MSRTISDLCALLVDETYGPLASQIYRTLLVHGRCTLQAVLRETEFKAQDARHGLAVLIQHSLIFWYNDGRVTTYESNISATYNLLRTGKYMQITEGRLGMSAASIVSYILRSGHARVEDVLQQCDPQQDSDPQPQDCTTTVHIYKDWVLTKRLKENGCTFVMKPDKAHQALCSLLRAGLVRKVHTSFFQTEADTRIEAEKGTKPIDAFEGKSKKERTARWEAAVQDKLYGWRYGTEEERDAVEAIRSSRKRSCEESDIIQSNTRRRLSGGSGKAVVNGNIEEAEGSIFDSDGRLKPDLALTINPAKFAVLLRSDRLVELAERSICQASAKIYRTVLDKIETLALGCRPLGQDDYDEYQFRVTTEDIVATVPESEDLQDALGTVHDDLIDNEFGDDDAEDEVLEHRKKRRIKDGVAQESGDVEEVSDIGSESESEDADLSKDSEEGMANTDYDSKQRRFRAILQSPHHNAVRAHLLLLAQHPTGFLKRASPQFHAASESWTVNFSALVENIQRQEIAQTISSRYGTNSMRLANILAEHGKLDDKTLSSLSLIREKDMRPHLTRMQKAGLLELQEVPRDSARVASRTNFLFFFDHQRCVRKLTEECYKTMTRLIERARVEKEDVQGTLDKASRSDVVGKEAQLLSKAERVALQAWRDTEGKLWNQVTRVDDMVALFRDF